MKKCQCNESTAGRWGCLIHSPVAPGYPVPDDRSMPIEPEDELRDRLWKLEQRVAVLEAAQSRSNNQRSETDE